MTVLSYSTIRRRGDRHRDRLTDLPIIAIDGEGMTVDNIHHYTLLAASNGTYIEGNSLSTLECFEFLLSLPKALVIGFAINYDINMMLRDLPQRTLVRLAKSGFVIWRQYSIQYTPSKQTVIKDRVNKRSVHIYDVFGFFQCSFVKALRQWQVGDSTLVNRIEQMKKLRGMFTAAQYEDVRAYCFDEVNLLVPLMKRLIVATQTAKIPCSQWYGVGALASGLMTKYQVKRYVTAPPVELENAILCGYFGGRFEISASGEIGPTYSYDIKSAYPSVARYLPCLCSCRYRHYSQEIPDSRYALYHVIWDVQGHWGPFPWRDHYGRIHYPLNGEGWYYRSEVLKAIALYPLANIKIIEGYTIEPQCEHTPFAFIDEVYRIRQQFEAAGDYAHKVLKLALNAIYGKTAQSIGHKGKKPPFQSYIWAGMITSGCRAQILDAIAQAPDNIVSIATDGIISRVPLQLEIGKGLGNWEAEEWDSTILVQPGIYQLTRDNSVIQHNRGFGIGDTTLTAITNDLFEQGIYGKHTYNATRFVGLASALARTDYQAYWRKWINTTREISFYPSMRFFGEQVGTLYTHLPPRLSSPVACSQAYAPKMRWLDSWVHDSDMLLDMDSL